MTTFVLVHGAYHSGAHWDLLAAELRSGGHTVVAPDLPVADAQAGAGEYAQTVVDAVADTKTPGDTVVVGHSMGGLTAPLAASLIPSTRHLVYVCALTPAPGRSLNEQLASMPDLLRSRSQVPPRANADGSASSHPAHACEMYYHDCTWQRQRWACSLLRPQHWRIVHEHAPLAMLPDIPATYIVTTHDRMLEPSVQRRLAGNLNATVVAIETGHAPMIAQPQRLTELLVSL